jgi:hypothetical protein
VSAVIDPAVLLDPNQPNPTDLSRTAERSTSKANLGPAVPCMAGITGLTVRGHDIILSLADDVEASRATNPKNFLCMVNGSTFLLSPKDITFDASARTVTFRRVPMHAGDHVGLTVMGLWDRNPDIPDLSCTWRTQLPEPRRHWIVGALIVAVLIVAAVIVVLVRVVI